MSPRQNDKNQPEKEEVESTPQKTLETPLDLLEKAGYRMVQGPNTQGPEDLN